MTCAAHSSGLAIAIFGPALRIVDPSELTHGSFGLDYELLFDQKCGEGGW